MTFFQRFRRTDVPESADSETPADGAEPAAAGGGAELADWVDGLKASGQHDTAPTDTTGETAQLPATEPDETQAGGTGAAADEADATETIAATGLAASAADDGAPADPAPPTEEGSGRGKRRARRRVLIGAATAAVLLLGGSGVAVASAYKTIDIDVDGQTRSVSTFAGSVDGLLEEAGVEIGPHDKVVPGVEEALQDGSDVVVRTGDQITIVEDGDKTKVWTTALTAGGALSYLGDNGRDASIEASRSSDGRVQLKLPLTADGPVTIVADGDERTIEVHGTVTLRQALRQAEIEIGKKDDVTVTTGKDGAPTVTVVRHSTETKKKTEPVDNEVVQRETDELYEGQSRVVQEGRDGERTITVRQQLTDGDVTDTNVVSSKITTDPVDRVVEVGTAERPAPEPAPSTGSSSSGSSSSGESSESGSSSGSEDSSGSAPTSGVWAKLAQCESGGNPNAVNPAGPYYGLYQFTAGTWHSVGGSGVPTDASAAEQTRRAQMLQQRSGWGQWPACAAQLGLL